MEDFLCVFPSWLPSSPRVSMRWGAQERHWGLQPAALPLAVTALSSWHFSHGHWRRSVRTTLTTTTLQGNLPLYISWHRHVHFVSDWLP